MIAKISVTPGNALQNPNIYQYQSHGHISNRKKARAINAPVCAAVDNKHWKDVNIVKPPKKPISSIANSPSATDKPIINSKSF